MPPLKPRSSGPSLQPPQESDILTTTQTTTSSFQQTFMPLIPDVQQQQPQQPLGLEFFDPFYQGHKNTTILNPVLKGQNVIVLGSDGLSEFNKEMTVGVYDIDLKINLKIRFKFGKIKTPRWFKPKPKINCGLKVPINGNGRLDGGVVANTCRLDYWVFG